jgi:hypothetical protein
METTNRLHHIRTHWERMEGLRNGGVERLIEAIEVKKKE